MAKESKVAFITGLNRGIGLETARQLGKQGVTVVIGSRDAAKGKEVANKLRAGGADVQAIRFDITKPADSQEAYKFFDKNFGKLDILINNAGTLREQMGAPNNTSSVSSAALRETFDTNFLGTIELTQVLLPLIRKAPGGRIVNLSSILGSLTLHADPNSPIYSFKTLAYDASNAALNAFTIHLAGRIARYEDQGELCASRLGENGDGVPMPLPWRVPEGAKTSVQLALPPANGPTGGFHMGEALPW